MASDARLHPLKVDDLRRALERRLGDGRVLTDQDRMEDYCRDWSGADPAYPDLVVEAASADEVEAVLSIAQDHRCPVTPRGMGSGKAGGSVPVHGGLVLGLRDMRGVEEVHTGDLVAVARAGTPLQSVHEAATSEGLFYPPDPGSAHLCSIGGNVACNAGGPRALKYGTTKHYVLGLEVVTPATGRIRLGARSVKQATGFDLTALVVGSEGLLGIITEVTLRLLPQPRSVCTAMVGFPSVGAASVAVTRAFTQGLHPRCLELLDPFATRVLAEQAPGVVPDGADAVLIVETDGTETGATEEMARLAECFESAGAGAVSVAQHEGQREQIWAPRRMLSEALRRTAHRKRSEDVTVPRSQIPSFLDRLQRVAEETQVRVAAYGHAGDGNLHVNVLFDPDQVQEADRVLESVAKICIEMGGTLSGEHGLGRLKRNLLPLEQSSKVIRLQQALKAQFDPAGILNPGKVFPSGFGGWE